MVFFAAQILIFSSFDAGRSELTRQNCAADICELLVGQRTQEGIRFRQNCCQFVSLSVTRWLHLCCRLLEVGDFPA